MMRRENGERKEKLSNSAFSGVVALVFLILGFQLAVFVMKVVRQPAVEEELVPEPLAAENVQTGGCTPEHRVWNGGSYGGGRSSGGVQPQRSPLGGYEAPEPQGKRLPQRIWSHSHSIRIPCPSRTCSASGCPSVRHRA